MKTLILPGYSVHNRDWAYEIENYLKPQMAIVHEWGHWTAGSFSLPRELKNILEEIGDNEINIIAKSIGTRVTMYLIPKIINKLNKVILCGIPTKFESETVKTLYQAGLQKLGADNVRVFQNTADPFSPFVTVREFIKTVDPKIKVIEKPAHNHDYPYFEDFASFLMPVENF